MHALGDSQALTMTHVDGVPAISSCLGEIPRCSRNQSGINFRHRLTLKDSRVVSREKIFIYGNAWRWYWQSNVFELALPNVGHCPAAASESRPLEESQRKPGRHAVTMASQRRDLGHAPGFPTWGKKRRFQSGGSAEDSIFMLSSERGGREGGRLFAHRRVGSSRADFVFSRGRERKPREPFASSWPNFRDAF